MRKKISILIGLFLGLVLGGCASSTSIQTPLSSSKNIGAKIFGTKQYDEESEDAILLDDDTSFILANQKRNSLVSYIVLIKVDKNGNKIWERYFGDKTKNTKGYSLVLSHDKKSIYIVGSQESMVDQAHAYLLKVDLNGKILKEKNLQTSSLSNLLAIEKTNGGYILAGYVSKEKLSQVDKYLKRFIKDGYLPKSYLSNQEVGKDIYILKINTNDNIIWEKVDALFKKNSTIAADNFVQKILIDNKGNINLYTVSNDINYAFGRTASENVVVKVIYNQNGEKTGVFSIPSQYVKAVYDAKNIDGKTVLLGRAYGYVPNEQIWFYIPDSSERFGFYYGGENLDVGNSFETIDNKYMILGTSIDSGEKKPDIILMEVDSRGHQKWIKRYGGDKSDWAGKLLKLSDNSFMIVGTSRSYSKNNQGDVFLLHVDKNGNLK